MVVGGLDHAERTGDLARLDGLLPVETLITAGRPGAELMGEKWASPRGVLVIRFYPCEDLYGDDALPRRDREMLAFATDIAVFPCDKWTDHMILKAKAAGLTVHDFRAAAAPTVTG